MIWSLHPARVAAAVTLLLAAAAVALLAAAVVALRADPAAPAQTQGRPCEPRSAVIQRLAENYGETLQSMGMNAGDLLLEVYASEATGTWTILVTNRDGTACMVEAGEAWESRAALPGKDA